MLSTDNIILEILSNAKNAGNKLLKHFKISYPTQELAQENNCIMVAVVSSENQLNGFDFEEFSDLVEILIITKQEDNFKASKIIKTVSYEICKLIMNNEELFPNKPVIRSLNPFFDVDMTLTRGQVMVNVNTEPVDFELSDDVIEDVCNLLVADDYIDVE